VLHGSSQHHHLCAERHHDISSLPSCFCLWGLLHTVET
jgi:hypothetical protein